RCGASGHGRRLAAALLSTASAEEAGPAAHRILRGMAHSRAVCPRHARPLRHGGGVAYGDRAYSGASRSDGGGRRGSRPEAGRADGRGDPGPHAILKNNSPGASLCANITLLLPTGSRLPVLLRRPTSGKGCSTFSAIWIDTVGSTCR